MKKHALANAAALPVRRSWRNMPLGKYIFKGKMQ